MSQVTPFLRFKMELAKLDAAALERAYDSVR